MSPFNRNIMIGAIVLASAVCIAAAGSAGEVNECLEGRLERGHWAADTTEHRFDEQSGRDLRHYAPDRPADFVSMKLELDIPDMEVPALTAREHLTFIPTGKPLAALRLDAEGLQISAVELIKLTKEMVHTSFHHDGHELMVTFNPPLAVGREYGLDIAYTLEDPADGLFWTTSSPAWPGRPPQVHSQGQPETNRYWFCCHDSPNERMTTELIVTVPTGFEVISNGELIATQPADGRTTFHWKLDQPHPAYLVTMVIGKFATVDVAPAGSSLRLPVHVPEQWAGRVANTYGRTADMVKVFEERFDEPYPWGNRYAQVLVWNFGAGGMENTSATTMYDTAVFDEVALADGDLDGLISHELAHQWFGDLLTCNTWAHIWLNEGWATYSESLWMEARDGYSEGYLFDLIGSLRGLAEEDQIAPDKPADRPGMVSTIYEHPWDVFNRTSNPYPKGAAILHMLRMKLGDELFFKGVAAYIDEHRLESVVTEDFRAALEGVSGVSLEQFFDQWCYRPGTPDLHITTAWDEAGGQLAVTIEQRQRIDADNPAFTFDLPVQIFTDSAGEPVRRSIAIDSRRHELSFPLDAAPKMVLIDPDLTVLAKVTLDHPREMLLAQMRDGTTVPAQVEAIKALRRHKAGEVTRALTDVLLDAEVHFAVRREATATLGALARTTELALALDASRSGDPRVRAAIIEALGKIDTDAAYTAVAPFATGAEKSYACRAEALKALGRSGNPDHLPAIRAALEVESQNDRIRTAALEALASFDDAQDIALAAKYAAPGSFGRTRPTAIDTIRTLADLDPEAAYESLAPLLVPSVEQRAVRALIDALSHIKDERGLATLAAFADRTKDPILEQEARDAHERLAALLRGDTSLEEAHSRIEHLERELSKLRNEFNGKGEE